MLTFALALCNGTYSIYLSRQSPVLNFHRGMVSLLRKFDNLKEKIKLQLFHMELASSRQIHLFQ